MRKFRPSLLSGLLVAALVVALAIPAAADLVPRQLQVDAGVEVYIDGNQLDPRDVNGNRVDALLYNGTTYVPVRAVTESLGYDVAWNGADDVAYISSVANDPLAAEYLEEYFAIAPFTGTVSRADFDAALVKVGGTATEGTGELTVADAVVAAVKTAGMDALAVVYTDADSAKANARIAAYGLAPMAAPTAAYVAAALDAGLASATWDLDGALDAVTASNLLMNVVNVTGQGRNYLGLTTDKDIAAKLRAAFAAIYDFSTLDNEAVQQLWAIGETIVAERATTGFGLKSDDYDARFLDEYTIQYGHSNINHAVQLVALLASEGIEAKVALEPKISIFEYPAYSGDLGTSIEYDMNLEFSSLEDREAFHDLVNPYVTRNMEGNTSSQITGAWLTPCFNSYAAIEGYNEVCDNVISCGKYSLHPFSLPDQVETVSATIDEAVDAFNASLAEGGTPIETEVVPIWCNPAFYVYLQDMAASA